MNQNLKADCSESGVAVTSQDQSEFRHILGVPFFIGDARSAVERMREGGLLVVPSAPALKDMTTNLGYRDAILNADLVIADSGFMVLLWNLLERDSIRRLSGLEYLRELVRQPDFREPGGTFWIMASSASAERNVEWLREQGLDVNQDCLYVAPIYENNISDPVLVERIRKLRPRHVVVTVGGGTQEPLGLYLKRNLDYLPAIHCIGAAIAFLSGDQVNIPVWADKLYLGWFFRCLSQPARYVPRYWKARKLLGLLLRYRNELPSLQA